MAKKRNKTTIDTSGAVEFRAKLHREKVKKLLNWNSSLDEGLTLGTSKGINSIISKAQNKGKVAKAKSDKIEEELIEKRIAKKKLRSSQNS